MQFLIFFFCFFRHLPYGRVDASKPSGNDFTMLRFELTPKLKRVVYVLLQDRNFAVFKSNVGSIASIREKLKGSTTFSFKEELAVFRSKFGGDSINPCYPHGEVLSGTGDLLNRVAQRRATRQTAQVLNLIDDGPENDSKVLFVFPIHKKAMVSSFSFSCDFY